MITAAAGDTYAPPPPRLGTIYLDCSPLGVDDVRDSSRTSADALTALIEALDSEGGVAVRMTAEVLGQQHQWSSGRFPFRAGPRRRLPLQVRPGVAGEDRRAGNLHPADQGPVRRHPPHRHRRHRRLARARHPDRLLPARAAGTTIGRSGWNEWSRPCVELAAEQEPGPAHRARSPAGITPARRATPEVYRTAIDAVNRRHLIGSASSRRTAAGRRRRTRSRPNRSRHRSSVGGLSVVRSATSRRSSGRGRWLLPSSQSARLLTVDARFRRSDG